MSLPITAGSTDKTLEFEAYLDDGTVKTDLVAADVDTLIVDRGVLADVTIYNETGPVGSVSNKSTPTTTHSDGAIYSRANGRYSVDIPDSAVASVTTVQIRGTWTDGSNTGYFVGLPTSVVGYDASVARLGAAAAGAEMDLVDSLNTTAITQITTAVWNYVIDGTRSAAGLFRIFTAILAGKASRSDNVTTFRNIADTKDVYTSTASGDSRSSVSVEDDT